MRTLSVLVAFAAFAPAQEPARKRPLTHADYDIWNSVTASKLSPDGQWFVYLLKTPKGDGELVVKNTVTLAETRFPTSSRAVEPVVPTKGEAVDEEDQTAAPTPLPPIGAPAITPDSRFAYFFTTPLKADADKLDDKAKAAEPRRMLVVLELATGQVVKRIEKVNGFRIVGDGAGVLIVEKEPKAEPAPETKPETAPMPKKADDVDDQPPGKGKGGLIPGLLPRATATAKDLLVTDLATGKEASFADVGEYSLTRDQKSITYTVTAKAVENNGVFVAPLLDSATAVAAKTGAGKYSKLTWDRDEKQLAFFHDDAPKVTPPSVASPAKPKLFLWQRAKAKEPAVEILGADVAGLKKGWQVVDRGGVTFSADGTKVYVATAPIPPAPAEPEKKAEPKTPTLPGRLAAAADEKVDLDLWHWKDEAVQTMQKARAATDRNRTYLAAYFLDTKQFRHLHDDTLVVNPPSHGDWSFGYSDKRVRYQTWASPVVGDYSLVNIRTGESKPVKPAQFGYSPSPTMKQMAGFDGKDWFFVSVPDGKTTPLTATLPTTFFRDDHDIPDVPQPYPSLGWSSDDKFFYASDKYDIWRFAADGSAAVNVTKIGRTSGIQFKLIRVEKDDDSTALPVTGLDPSKPWLLAAENLETRDTGIYRMEPGQAPKLLVMGARKYGAPTKARKADTTVFTAQSFRQYPDTFAADRDFHEVKRLTDINPRTKDFLWGTAELVSYKSLDGTPLRATLYKPEGFDPAKKYPMIVYIYERLTDRVHDFRLPAAGTSINPTYYTSNGYLVLMPDVKFDIGTPGQSSLKCVLSAIQAVSDQGFLDDKAVGIQGHSWGGYQIAYMVTQTNRFRAAVAGAPVSNMVSAYGGIRWGSGMPRQMQYEKGQSRIGETPWQAPMKYLENSPIFMADRVKTPLLMLHNDQDDAVPWYQGIEYFLALRRLGKEVYLLNYNGQPHGLTKKAAQRDYTLRMQQFFDHHLKGAAMPAWMEKGVPFAERDSEKEQWKKLFGPEAEKK